jgi:hypothetical protein
MADRKKNAKPHRVDTVDVGDTRPGDSPDNAARGDDGARTYRVRPRERDGTGARERRAAEPSPRRHEATPGTSLVDTRCVPAHAPLGSLEEDTSWGGRDAMASSPGAPAKSARGSWPPWHATGAEGPGAPALVEPAVRGYHIDGMTPQGIGLVGAQFLRWIARGEARGKIGSHGVGVGAPGILVLNRSQASVSFPAAMGPRGSGTEASGDAREVLLAEVGKQGLQRPTGEMDGTLENARESREWPTTGHPPMAVLGGRVEEAEIEDLEALAETDFVSTPGSMAKWRANRVEVAPDALLCSLSSPQMWVKQRE